jgi:hypothetical protein
MKNKVQTIQNTVNTCTYFLCFLDRASLYNLVNKANLVHNLFLAYLLSVFLSICTCFGRLCARETTVFLRHLVLVILCGWLSGMQGVSFHPAYQTVIQVGFIYKTSTHITKNTLTNNKNTHTYTHPHITEPTHTHTLQNPIITHAYLRLQYAVSLCLVASASVLILQ